MKIEKRSKNSYRVRKMIDKKIYTFNFDHKPTQKEIMYAIENRKENVHYGYTLINCANNYIKIKSNVLSASTLRGYNGLIKQFSDNLANKDIGDITQIDIQVEINEYSKTHSPKSTRNYHSFISTVLALYRPDFVLKTTLPKIMPKEDYIPTDEDIQAIKEAAVGTEFQIPFLLACHGLRRSEICALTLDDLEGNTLHINKAKVQDSNKQWVIKSTKTASSTREIVLDDSIVDLIMEKGYIFNGYPNQIYKWLVKTQKELNIEHFSLHKLRHYCVSKLSAEGVPDVDIMAVVGYKTDHVMKQTYRHSMADKTKKKEIFKKLGL